jgi:flagellin-like hook-associated protein FlgL
MIDGAPLGSMEISNAGQSRTLDLSGAQTFADVRTVVEDAGLGMRVEIDRATNTINIVNEVSAGRAGAMSISAVTAGDTTAERLGVRSFSADTRIEDLNFGRGVRINTVSGSSGPSISTAGGSDDFRITLGDGRQINIDLRPQDIVTIGTVVQRINDQVSAAGVTVPGEFEASVSDVGNGIRLEQSSAFAQPINVSQLNNSYAFGDLGFGAGGTLSPSGDVFTTEDRARVRVDSVFSDLIDLRDSLRADDAFGITFAGEDLETSVSTVAQTRGIVGGYQRRVERAIIAQEDKMLIDEQIRSELRDLDFSSAAVRLNLLQTQLSAGLQTTALLQSRSLLDFLG